ncbi:MAG TPA: sn-glycerol-3-phosphate ABC transporter ATP-binding protein UgpC [Acidimicrobiales bacterium]|nr:sn-glycerol-3-phosphate ABC transporter ATP-binding protein UgpC [Acidimicrobiales bacterium]
MADIAIRGITKSYDGRTRAVDRVDLDITDGELLVLVGPSGCGKSTLLRMIAGLEEVTEGTVAIGGRDVTTSQPRARDVAMVFQSYALYPHMSVARNIGYPLRLAKVPRAEIARRVAEVAEVLQLTEVLDRKPSQLSGGQRQRVAMGRAIIRQPQVFLMDEPLSNLDAKLRVEMRAEIARLQRELAVTTVYVTHDQTEAMTMGTRVAVLRDGRLQQVDTPQRLYDDPVNLFVATFIGSPSMNVFGGTIEPGAGDGLALRLGDQRLALGGDVVAAHPRLRGLVGRPVVAGIRPEAFDLAGASGAPAGAAVEATVDLVESLGAELIVHLSVAGPPADAVDAQGDAWAQVVGRKGRAVARLGTRVRPAPGDVVELVVDTSGLHLFDPQTGASLRGAAQDATARDRDAADLATTDA